MAFFGPAASTVGGGLSLATFAGLPTCAFLGTLVGGGVTAGGTAGVGVAFAGGMGALSPPHLHLTGVCLSTLLLASLFQFCFGNLLFSF